MKDLDLKLIYEFPNEYSEKEAIIMDKIHQTEKTKVVFKYGNASELTYPDVNYLSPSQKKHKYTWTLKVEFPLNSDELKKIVQSVTFKMQSSIKNPVRTLYKPPFEVKECGNLPFKCLITIDWRPCIKLKPYKVTHFLSLGGEDNMKMGFISFLKKSLQDTQKKT